MADDVRPDDIGSAEPAGAASAIGRPEVFSRPRRLWVVAAAVPLLLGFLVWALSDSLAAEQVTDLPRLEVPDLAGLDEAEARARLEALDFVVEEERIPNELVDEGLVIGQQPLARALIEQGSVVTVVVSDGDAGQRVPDVVGETAADATAVLQANGLAVELLATDSWRVDKGSVISTTPPAGERVELSGTVTALISTGPPPVSLPELVGTQIEETLVELGRLGLGVGRIREVYDPDVPERRVLETAPIAGTSMELGTAVELTVAGPPPTRTVPYLVGLTRASAAEVASATNVNISFTTVALPAGDARDGRVVDQGVPGGAEIRSGVIVEVTVGVAASPPTTQPPTSGDDGATDDA